MQHRERQPRLSMIAALAGLIGVLPAAEQAAAAPRWMLVYYRQLGNNVNSNGLTIENHLFREDGTRGANVGVTNQSNSHFAIFGHSNADGWHRINPLDVNNCSYDIRIYDPGVATEQTPSFYFQNPPAGKFYSYITHWMHVTDDARITTYPTMPVYHYDLVNGINQVSGMGSNCVASTFTEPAGASSDARTLNDGGWATYQAQTFVVPEGVNRIVTAQAAVTRQAGVKFFYRATIRQGSPTGPQIGGAATSPEVFSTDFKEVAVSWPLEGPNSVPVTPGQTYALRLDATDGQGFNAFVTIADNYPHGILYQGTTQRPGQDLQAVLVGVGLDLAPPNPPTISRSPSSFNRNVAKGTNLSSDTFDLSNSGGATLNYTLTSNQSWLAPSPVNGSSIGEVDPISILYDTSGLNTGPYTGIITITAPGATNTPQSVTVNLTVNPPPFSPVDFDLDGDVDQTDFGHFQRCFSGSGIAQTDPDCAGARLDDDLDVDQDDFTIFHERCYSGPDVPADTICDE